MPVKANSTVGAEVNIYSKNWSSLKWVATSQILTKFKNFKRIGFLYPKHNSDKKVSMIEAFFSILTKPNIYVSVCKRIFEYSNIFLQILIFVFDSWQFSKPNIIQIFEYFCMNISEYWSLKIT